MKKNTTKRSLLASVLALVMCVTMLVGTTFAWFTDSASTSVNKIEAGKLDVELLDESGQPLAKDRALVWKTTDSKVLWEPNCTYDLEPFQIKNAGNLALKYKVTLKATKIDKTADGKSLLDVIDWTIKLGDNVLSVTSEQIKDGLGNGIVIITDQPLLADKADTIRVTGHMREDAGNEYQGLTIDGFGISVVAAQLSYENDSKDNTYDEKAEYPVADAGALKTALAEAADGDTITLTGDVDLSGETVSVDADLTIKGEDAALQNAYLEVADGKKVSFDGVTIADTTTIRAKDDADLTFTNCEFNVTPEKKNGNGRAAAIIGNHQYSNVNLTLQGCTFNYQPSNADTYNMAVFMWSNVENVLIKDCVFNDYGFVAVKFLEMKAGANIVFEGNTFNMSGKAASNWYYNTAVQIHTVNQPTGNCNVSFINNKFTGDFQTGADSDYAGYEESSAPIVAELLWNASDDAPLNNTTLTISGNTVNGSPVTEANFVFLKGAGSSVIEK